jgi:hypothetical protein
MATKTEKILIGIDDKVIELTGADKDAFLAERAEMQKQEETRKTELESEKQLKIDAYTKLGLTKEEINSIL